MYFPVSRPASVKSSSKCFSRASFGPARAKYCWVCRMLIPELGADAGPHWHQGSFSSEFIGS